jgi:hypothetical protein
MSLSALYSLPLKQVCALSLGLDNHFLAQLLSLTRENMRNKVFNEFKEMEDHIASSAIDANELLKILEPIYK